MKNFILLLLIASACLFSCKKTKTVTVIQKDTVLVTPSLIGSWKTSDNLDTLVFTASTYKFQSFPVITYLASTDTIFDLSETHIVYPQWTYSFANSGNTLVLTSLSPVMGGATYQRTN